MKFVSMYHPNNVEKIRTRTYRLDLVSSHRLVALKSLRDLEDLATVDQAITRRNDSSASQLVGGQKVELGLGDGLGQDLGGDTRLSNALDSLDSLLSALAHCRGGTGDLDGQETGIGVGEVLSLDGSTLGGSGSLGEEAEAGRPLDAGLTAEQGGEDGSLGLVGMQVGAGECDDQGVGAGKRRALLTTVVLGSLGVQLETAGRRGWDVLEEGLNPLGQVGLGGTVGNDRDVGLGVDGLGEGSDGVLGQVRAKRCGAGRVEGGAETLVEGDSMRGVEGLGQGVVSLLGLLEVQDRLDLLVELVG